MVRVFISLSFLLSFLLFAMAPPARAQTSSYSWTIATDPMQWLVGPNLRVDYRFNESWSLGVAAFYENRMLRAVQTQELAPGLFLNYAFAVSQTHNWFLEAGSYYGDVHASYVDANSNTDRLTKSNYTARLLVGHQWYFGHFTMDVGAGAEWNSAGKSKIYDSAGTEVAILWIYPVRFLVEFALGFAF